MKKALAFIFIFLAMFIWGTSFLAMKSALYNIGSGMLIFLRSIVAFIILLPISFIKFKKLERKHIKLVILTGLCVGLGYLTQAVGLKYTTPGKSAFLEDAYCVTVPILTCIILKEKITLKKIICIGLCIAGVILISLDSINGSFGIGEILSIIAGIFYGLNITITGIYVKDANPISYTCFQFLVISIISFIYTIIFEGSLYVPMDRDTVLTVLYLGAVVSALAWIFRNYSQQILSPISVSIILPFSAVVGTAISVLFKEDTLNIWFIVGGVLITLSIILDTLLSNKKNKESVA